MLEDAAKDSATKGVGRLPARQCRLPADVRRQGSDGRRLRQRPSTSCSCASRTTGSPQSPWSRALQSATTTRPRTSARSTQPRRIRTAPAWRCRMSSMCRRISIRVVSPDVGGGFGLKGGVFPEDALVLWASRRLRRPVKWVATRSESMLTRSLTAATSVYYGELALERRARSSALRGALPLAARRLFRRRRLWRQARSRCASYPRRTMSRRCSSRRRAVFTNTSQSGPYRGAGRPEAAYFMERLIERAAHVIGIDPVDIRRRNLIPPSKLPYKTPSAGPTTAANSSVCWTSASR